MHLILVYWIWICWKSKPWIWFSACWAACWAAFADRLACCNCWISLSNACLASMLCCSKPCNKTCLPASAAYSNSIQKCHKLMVFGIAQIERWINEWLLVWYTQAYYLCRGSRLRSGLCQCVLGYERCLLCCCVLGNGNEMHNFIGIYAQKWVYVLPGC